MLEGAGQGRDMKAYITDDYDYVHLWSKKCSYLQTRRFDRATRGRSLRARTPFMQS